MSKGIVYFLLVAALAVALGLASGQSLPTLSSTSAKVTTGNASTLTTPSGEVDCSHYNSSCGACIENWQCYYCYKDNSCRLYPAEKILPVSECPLAQVRWTISCSVTFLAIVITAAAIVGVLLLALCCCCYCCCCRDSRRSGYSRMTGRDSSVWRDGRDIQMDRGNRRYVYHGDMRTDRTTLM
ncbi:pituitary tumor-transforming gene 1 protein-interacting protein-like [Branchiostoma lanceolatum]|uniref:pituitary tumor-transforming gene 1 protein-interacting protein-like n=1 Tax=Branchiostoma lanceolatum TaxID=7740 RepID=UPI0034534B93